MSSETGTVLVYYFIPSDGDREETPNTYKVRGSLSTITVREVRVRDTYGWMDPMSEDERVPLYNDAIIAKVLRVGWDLKNRVFSGTQDGHGSPLDILKDSRPNFHIQTEKEAHPRSNPASHSNSHQLKHSLSASPTMFPQTAAANVDLIDLNSEHQNSKWISDSGFI
ncbi:hypothetical protein HWI79_294 [Cryptosporidium felis]|nr:hypothetical protein HWI79_294 [Cryptosporidium felis]